MVWRMEGAGVGQQGHWSGAEPTEALSPVLTLCGAGLLGWGLALAQLVRQPQLHADEGLSALLGQFAPWLRP